MGRDFPDRETQTNPLWLPTGPNTRVASSQLPYCFLLILRALVFFNHFSTTHSRGTGLVWSLRCNGENRGKGLFFLLRQGRGRPARSRTLTLHTALLWAPITGGTTPGFPWVLPPSSITAKEEAGGRPAAGSPAKQHANLSCSCGVSSRPSPMRAANHTRGPEANWSLSSTLNEGPVATLQA